MKYLIVAIALTTTATISSQNTFVFNENGLTPENVISYVDTLPQSVLYEKTLKWTKDKGNNYDITINAQSKNELIQLTLVKDNAVKDGKFYFHIKYKINISFANGQYTLQPIEAQLKQNSKYDMGWKNFNLNDGGSFFKRGKVVKKYKSYVADIPAILNEVNTNLYAYLAAR